jgi:hypothetical protein
MNFGGKYVLESLLDVICMSAVESFEIFWMNSGKSFSEVLG